ncbi:MAG: cytochrome c [Anaerolineae bacterium]|nr:cytochrome c [Anaerolineae bacterium]
MVNFETYIMGQQVYANHCAECHGENGQGQFPDAPMQPDSTGRIGAPPHTSNGHTWHHGDGLLVRYVLEGGMGDPNRFYPMPAFGNVLSEEEVTAVIAYIKAFWSPEELAVQRERTLAE